MVNGKTSGEFVRSLSGRESVTFAWVCAKVGVGRLRGWGGGGGVGGGVGGGGIGL